MQEICRVSTADLCPFAAVDVCPITAAEVSLSEQQSCVAVQQQTFDLAHLAGRGATETEIVQSRSWLQPQVPAHELGLGMRLAAIFLVLIFVLRRFRFAPIYFQTPDQTP